MSDEEKHDDEHAEIEDDVDSGPRRSPRNMGRRRGRPSKARGRPLSSDEAAFRWTVRGVPPPVRTIALKAAEDRGMTVGDWLAEAIVAFSRAGGRPGAAAAAADEVRSNLPATEPPPDLIRLVRNIDQRLTALERRQTALNEPQQQQQPDEAVPPEARRERVGVLRRLFGRRR